MTDSGLPEQTLKGGRHFDQVARSYDSVRMSYPPALLNDMFGYAGNPLVRRVLEIGCGTGQATRAVATRRIPVVCIEPGPNLATLAQQNLADFTNVRVVCSSFEEWILEPEPFDLVFSANAIHWVDRKMRVRKTAQALRPGGTLAIFRSTQVKTRSALESEIDAARGGIAATEDKPDRLPKEADFRESGYFEEFAKLRYEGSQIYDADSYADLLFTLQRCHRIPREIRTARLRSVRQIIRDGGGTIRVKYVTHLLLARKTTQRFRWKRFFSSRTIRSENN